MDNIFYYPARVIRVVAPNLAQLFPDDPALLARYKERFPDSPEESPYFLRLEISNNSLDWYFTHMLTTTLQNFAAGADKGVGLQDSHSVMKLGYGRSLFGLYNSEPGTPPGWAARRGSGQAMLAIPQPQQYERTLCADYVIREIKLNNLTFASTDDFIRAADAGMVEEISVGFGGGSMACDICGAQYFSWECMHVAGFTYDIERNGQETTFLCTVGVNNSQLLEHSVVYAGATPNAVVVRKAEQEAEAGRLTRKQAAAIEERYRVRLPMPPQNWPGGSEQTGNNRSANTNERSKSKMDELDQIRAILGETNAPKDATAPDAVRWLIAENARLAPLADIGNAYRADLTEAAIAEGVRAMGDKFPQETYRNMFASAPIEQIKRLLESWGGASGGGVHGRAADDRDDRDAGATRAAQNAAPALPGLII